MDVVLTTNNNYYLAVKVAIKSFLDNNSFEPNSVFLLYSNLSESRLNKLKHLVERGKNRFIPVFIDEAALKCFPVSPRFTMEVYYRLLIQELLPKDLDRVLWLDSDIVVIKNLSSFYNQDFLGNQLVACKSINGTGDILKKMGFNDADYFNAGVLLFNLTAIREKTPFSKYVDFYSNNADKVRWFDQDILNGVFLGETKFAPYRLYNYHFFDSASFAKSELNFIRKSTCILHYIGPIKPWHSNYRNVLFRYWIKYALKSLTFIELFQVTLSRVKFSLKKILMPKRSPRIKNM